MENAPAIAKENRIANGLYYITASGGLIGCILAHTRYNFLSGKIFIIGDLALFGAIALSQRRTMQLDLAIALTTCSAIFVAVSIIRLLKKAPAPWPDYASKSSLFMALSGAFGVLVASIVRREWPSRPAVDALSIAVRRAGN